MKKKFLFLFVILLSIFLITSINVQAEGDDDNPDEPDSGDTTNAAWPLDFSLEDFNIKIEGVELRVYQLDSTKTTTTTTTNDDGTTSTTTTNEDSIAYINGTPTKTITLNAEEYTMEPEGSNDKLGDINTTFIDLKLNLTEDKIRSLLSEEMDNTTKDISYIVEVVLNYRITEYPDRFKYFMNVNMMRLLMGLFGSMTNSGITYTPTVSMDDTISQVINIAAIQKENEDSDVELYYETELNDSNDIVSYIYNPLVFSEEEINMSLSTEDTVDSTKTQYLLFHNVSNIQYLIDNFKKVEDETTEEAKDTVKEAVTDLEVNVPNTSQTKNILLVMISIVLLMSGSMMILYVLKIKEFRRLNN